MVGKLRVLETGGLTVVTNKTREDAPLSTVKGSLKRNVIKNESGLMAPDFNQAAVNS